MRLQRALGWLLAIVAVVAIARLARVLTYRVVLTDDALTIPGRKPIEPASIIGIRPHPSGIETGVELTYRRNGEQEQRVVLDRYYVKNLDELVSTICVKTNLPGPYGDDRRDGAPVRP